MNVTSEALHEWRCSPWSRDLRWPARDVTGVVRVADQLITLRRRGAERRRFNSYYITTLCSLVVVFTLT
ncbi:hypothetical protein KOW79_001391 [Hemibagrus wyckioides]|uniref:Uncharacterized protein n=1 Tax=Hemibagrus wyckioides TaxID=337641 RepID=A0A9D3P4Y2_9TELE|nr:hypothetical protein KOW79_001391 [Hemibagrus wyckioides]